MHLHIFFFLAAGADIIEVGAAYIHGPSEENPLFCVARDYGLLAPEALTKENQSMDVDERPPLLSNWFSSSGRQHAVHAGLYGAMLQLHQYHS